MPGRWLPWPGKRNASWPGPAGSAAGRLDQAPAPGRARRPAPGAAASSSSVEVVGATTATWVVPGPVGGRGRRPTRPGRASRGRPVRGGVAGQARPAVGGRRWSGGGPVRAAEAEQLGRPVPMRGRGSAASGVGAEHDVEVGAAEAERADPGDRSAAGAGHGRASVEERERAAARRRQAGLGSLDVEGRRQDAVVQGERRLDQPGQPGGALGVADLRLHRAEHAAARLGARPRRTPRSAWPARCGRRPRCRCRAPRPARPRRARRPALR